MSLNNCWFKSPVDNLPRLQQAAGRIRLYGVKNRTIVLHLNGEGPIAFDATFTVATHAEGFRTALRARRVDLDCIDVPKHTIADVRFTREVERRTTRTVCYMLDQYDNHTWLSFGFNDQRFINAYPVDALL